MEIKGRRKVWQTLERSLGSSEQRITGAQYIPKLPISQEDLGYLFEDLNYNRSTFPPHVILPKPMAMRWDIRRDVSIDNVVIIGPKEAEKHEKECLIGGQGLEDVWGKDVVDMVGRRSEEARQVLAYRRP